MGQFCVCVRLSYPICGMQHKDRPVTDAAVACSSAAMTDGPIIDLPLPRWSGEEAVRRGYMGGPGSCPNGYRPIMKRIMAVAGMW